MPIRVVCECGSRLDAPEELAGRQARCGACGAVLTIGDRARPAAAPDVAVEPSAKLPPKVIRKRKKVFRKTTLSPEEASVRKKRRSAPPPAVSQTAGRALLDVWKRGLIFPLRTEALITLVVMATLYGFVSKGYFLGPAVFAAGIFGISSVIAYGVVSALLAGYLSFFLLQTLRATAHNEQDLPVTAAFDFTEIYLDLWLMIGGTIVVLFPWIFLEIGTWLRGWPLSPIFLRCLLLFLLFLWPMGATSAALHTTVLAANHWTTLAAILRLPFQYLATLSVAGGLVALVLLLDASLPRVFFISGFVSSFLFFYTVVACIALMGGLYHRNRLRIGWFGELQRQY